MMARWWAWQLAAATLAAVYLRPSQCGNAEFSSDTLINNLVMDPRTGRLYVGAINNLYQLNPDLHVEHQVKTGPKKDDQRCTPPITSACDSAADTPNHNKLLLVYEEEDKLVVCGSLFRGICAFRNLSNVEKLVYYSDTTGEKSYVASSEAGVSVVGVTSTFKTENNALLHVFLVAKGYGTHDSAKLISTRTLQNFSDWVNFDNIVESSTVQANSFASIYSHDFRFAFKDGGFLYFLFSRKLGQQGTKNFTFIARLCENDKHYYSYTELPLNCSATNKYNKAQAGFVGTPGEVLAQNLTESKRFGRVSGSDKVLFVTFTSEEEPSSSALCMFPLKSINNRLVEMIEACYDHDGTSEPPAVYTPYSSKTEEPCNNKHPNMASKYSCGEEFLPSPLAGKAAFALTAEPSFVRKSHMTAVAVAVVTEHAVAFLGTSTGEVLKVHLSARAEEFGRAPADVTGDKVNKNLLFDSSLQHLYITSGRKITKVPVQSCHLKQDCQSCVSMKDPYCGWCVLEGKCSRKQDCSRSAENNTWLWSPDETCVQIQDFQPQNLSCKKEQQVVISIPMLPRLEDTDELRCIFNDRNQEFVSVAVASRDNPVQVTCSLPGPEKIPPTPHRQDNVSVPVRVEVNEILLTSGEYYFYNCAATVWRNENTPCISCVTSSWGCQWDALDYLCRDEDEAVSGEHVIKPQQPDKCPQFESPELQLIPVGYKTPIDFRGRNLKIYDGMNWVFFIGTELMKKMEVQVEVKDKEASEFTFPGFEFSYDEQQEVNVSFHIKHHDPERKIERKIDSTLTVVLYNCSVGRGDCSLCKHAADEYGCVWCGNTCLYREICKKPEPAQCPDPNITDIIPRFGPLDGSIDVTIRGSNMGIKKEDIKKITVAGVECTHLPDRYSVSTSVVCEIGPKKENNYSGLVEIEVQGGRTGTSSVNFTYRNPIPESILPSKGPAAGGTEITITGRRLDTATKHDVAVFVGNVPCEVLMFGENIICKTGAFAEKKVPSDKLAVTVKYGKITSKQVPGTFEYCENPKITDYNPKSSFFCGGRKIVMKGSGFDLIQSAKMKVLPGTDQDAVNATYENVTTKSDTVLEFFSPPVNSSEFHPSLRTVVQLDNLELNLTDFEYYQNPKFELPKKELTEGSVIIVNGHGFTKAMTVKEAMAFVGGVSCNITILQDDKLILDDPSTKLQLESKRLGDTTNNQLEVKIAFGQYNFSVGSVSYAKKDDIPLAIIIPAVIVPMLLFIAVSVYCYRRKSQQAEREYEKVKHQLENLEESVRDRCKKEFTDLMIEMEDHTSDLSEGRIPFLDYKTYTDRNFFLPSKEGDNDPMITGKIQIPEARRAIVAQALNQFSNLLNSKTFLINFIRTLESRPDFKARSRGYFASLLTVALHGKLEYYTDIMRTLLLELMEEHVQNKNPKLMLRRSETVVERMLCNWMSICLYQFLRDTAGEPLYKLFKALKHQVEKGPVDARLKKAKYTLNDTGLLGDDVEYSVLTVQVLVPGEGPDVTPVKVLNCDSITQVKEKIIDQVYRNLPYSQRPKVDNVALEWRPGSTGQILSDLDLTSQKEGRWRRLNTLAHYNVRDNATLVLSRVLHTKAFHQQQDSHDEKNALLEDDNTFHLVRPADEIDEVKSKRGSMKDKAMTKAITEIYLTRLLSVKGTLQQFVDDFFRSVLCSGSVVPPAVKYFFDFLDEQALRHDNVDEETLHIWKTNSLPLRFWVNILRNPHFIFDVHVTEVVDASLHVIAQTFMDACTKTEHKLSRESPSNKLLYAKEISTYKKMVDDYYSGIRQMIQVSDQDMNTHLAEVSRQHTEKLNTQVALHQLYQYASKYFDAIIQSLDEDPAAQSKQLTVRLQQVAAALENKTTDL
ncbi:plexin-B2 [Kryptolebias marmoratus]|nr:plexin-B2 [Kryptolebias marmoratus]